VLRIRFRRWLADGGKVDPVTDQRDTDIARITSAYNLRNPRLGTFSFDVAAVARLAVESRDREDSLQGAVTQLCVAVTEYLESGTAEQRARLELLKRG
jgi:hypothetical protein